MFFKLALRKGKKGEKRALLAHKIGLEALAKIKRTECFL